MRKLLAITLVLTGALYAIAEWTGSAEPFGAPSSVFADDVVLAAPPGPPATTGTPSGRLTSLVDRANAAWQGAFARSGLKWTPARIAYLRMPQDGCPVPPEAAYCIEQRLITVNARAVEAEARVLGSARSFDRLSFAVGHEIGHHVDAISGNGPVGPPGELRATCLAGAFMRAVLHGDPPRPRFAGDELHGTAAENDHAFGVGAASGRPRDCDRPLHHLP